MTSTGLKLQSSSSPPKSQDPTASIPAPATDTARVVGLTAVE